jgi:protein-S-isoprenylcysteine O-methyltransferase Ste14
VTSEPRSLLWPTLGTVVFVILAPGSVVVLLPYLITRWSLADPFLGLEFVRWSGALLILLGLPVFLDFLVRFVRDGRGTPAPIAEPERLVVTGGFRSVRNPGYVAVLAMIGGQALIFGSTALLGYTAAAALAFHLFVVLYEEPHLRRKFGSDYEDYCRRVPRWLPRRRGAVEDGNS